MAAFDKGKGYERYHIPTKPAQDIEPWPSRFRVRVDRVGLARLLLRELWAHRADLDVVLSRPCVYGVFSGPLGGFAPREQLCVGCLRCTTQHPDFVEIRHNPERRSLGDSYFHSRYVDAVALEAATGSIPVRGAGYRGKFAGDGWDGMWTDMSEIVRPTRDGIHGREFISTVVDVGEKHAHLSFDSNGRLVSPSGETITLPVPFLFNVLPANSLPTSAQRIVSEVARQIGTLAVVPLAEAVHLAGPVGHVAPLIPGVEYAPLSSIPEGIRLAFLDGWNPALFEEARKCLTETIIGVRLPFSSGQALLEMVHQGARVFLMTADYHGRGTDGRFIFDLIRDAHETLVQSSCRDQVTLLGSGGIVAAEHVPKAIIAGLDAVVLDTPLLVALQARFNGELRSANDPPLELPRSITQAWGVQRLMNLAAAWRDQLLEVLGAMGLREVRRLRGEMGRAMFFEELEKEAFAGIEGYYA